MLALGASAAHALLGRRQTIARMRGEPLTWPNGRRGLVTVHPSYLLRIRGEDAKARELKAFGRDLSLTASMIER